MSTNVRKENIGARKGGWHPRTWEPKKAPHIKTECASFSILQTSFRPPGEHNSRRNIRRWHLSEQSDRPIRHCRDYDHRRCCTFTTINRVYQQASPPGWARRAHLLIVITGWHVDNAPEHSRQVVNTTYCMPALWPVAVHSPGVQAEVAVPRRSRRRWGNPPKLFACAR